MASCVWDVPASAVGERVVHGVRLKWLHQTQFAGIYVADQRGTYLYEAMMGRLDVDRSPINEIDATAWDIDECWQTADVCAHYATNGLARAGYGGVGATVLWPSDCRTRCHLVPQLFLEQALASEGQL